MSDPEKIWLMPEQCADPEWGRLWAPDNVGEGCPDEMGEELPWVPYIRQDLADAENERLRSELKETKSALIDARAVIREAVDRIRPLWPFVAAWLPDNANSTDVEDKELKDD